MPPAERVAYEVFGLLTACAISYVLAPYIFLTQLEEMAAKAQEDFMDYLIETMPEW